MKLRNISIIILALLLVFASITGCGKTPTDVTTPTPAPDVTDPTPSPDVRRRGRLAGVLPAPTPVRLTWR